MDIPIAERRQIENEMIFRRVNEKIGDDMDALDIQHIYEDNPELIRNDDTLIYFKCECSDENCDARIPIKWSVYQKIHKNRDAFIIKLKHQVNAIEKVILTEADYSVVEKNNTTAEPNDTLKSTNIDNS